MPRITGLTLIIDRIHLESATMKTIRENIRDILNHIKSQALYGNAFVRPEIQQIFEECGFHLSTTHYYSPIVSLDQARQVYRAQRSYEFALQSQLDAKQWELMKNLLSYVEELRDIPRDPLHRGFYWNNPMFPPLDAIAYYGLNRELRPCRVFEIGSGHSTLIALKAAAYHDQTTITCIEPYPGAELNSVADRIRLISSPIEKVNLNLFSELEEGDILFFDTSHTVKIGSDVNYIIFEVLPRLAPGVWIHCHDIFLPFEYPKHWIHEIGIQWNEQYLIGALLMSSSSYKVKLMNYWLSTTYAEELNNYCQMLPIWNLTENLGGARGASLWMLKMDTPA